MVNDTHKNADIKAIIFDCDGTLISSEISHFYAWQKVVVGRNHFFSFEDYLYCMGNGNPAVAKRFAEKMNVASPEELLSECHSYYQERAQNGHDSIQHTVDFVLQLAKERERLGIKLAVASASRKNDILQNLKQIGIESLFDVIVSGQDDLHEYNDPQGVNKPSPYIYLHAAKLLGVEPSSCVVVEDSLPGLQAGIRAGCFTIAVPTSFTKIQDLSQADLVLSSFEDVSVDQFFCLVRETKLQKDPSYVPTIIFLNGTSSAGKTSLASSLQEKFDKPFLHIGIDHFLFMLPERYRMDGKESHLGYQFKREAQADFEKITIIKGVYGEKMNTVMREAMHNFLSHHFNLIIDELLFEQNDFQAYLELLQPYRVYFIAVKPPLEVAEEREKRRGNRTLGLARSLYDVVYRNKKFDLEVDSAQFTTEEAAAIIVDFIRTHPHPQAFKQHGLLACTLPSFDSSF